MGKMVFTDFSDMTVMEIVVGVCDGVIGLEVVVVVLSAGVEVIVLVGIVVVNGVLSFSGQTEQYLCLLFK
jgi:hypothetical protein